MSRHVYTVPNSFRGSHYRGAPSGLGRWHCTDGLDHPVHMTNHVLARYVACPDCDAAPGVLCSNPSTPHLSRQRIGRRECLAAHELAQRWRVQRDGVQP